LPRTDSEDDLFNELSEKDELTENERHVLEQLKEGAVLTDRDLQSKFANRDRRESEKELYLKINTELNVIRTSAVRRNSYSTGT
jgi:hypothetical protein